MIEKILSGVSYAVASTPREGGKEVDILTLVAAFGRAGVREGFSISSGTSWGGAGVATISVREDIPFTKMASVMRAVSQAFNANVYLSPSSDVAGKAVMDAPMTEARNIVCQTSILRA